MMHGQDRRGRLAALPKRDLQCSSPFSQSSRFAKKKKCKDPNYELPTRRVKKRHAFGLGADRDPNIVSQYEKGRCLLMQRA